MQRTIYMRDLNSLLTWHDLILQKQGFGMGRRYEQYQLHGKLGEGAFGAVLLATHKQSRMKLAIKVINR